MGLIKSHGDSNAATKVSNQKGEAMSPAECGYTTVPFPGEHPAESNAEVGITKGSMFTDNQGTSMGAYKHQPKKPDAKTGS